MNPRRAWAIIAGVALVALGGTAAAGAVAWAQYDERANATSEVATGGPAAIDEGRIVFRSTASGRGYGHVASVSAAAPEGERAVSDAVCDRVDADAGIISCVRTVRGITPSYTAEITRLDGTPLAQWPLAGIPSRTRISPSGELVATTAFVTGHSYATVGFSTDTSIHRRDGEDLGDLEQWTLLIDGTPSAPVDRNYWGVTFIDDTSFYATVGIASAGTTYLVRGDIATRTFTALAENVECPSLSPDGTRIAFKRLTAGSGPDAHWTPAVYDIGTGDIQLLPETRGIDDQIEWLDDDTILYGLPRDDVPGDSDIWALAADGSGSARVFIAHAWSPAVVHDGTDG
ncbi:hypothetical protein LQ938_03275 [Microbacterium sp. cx-55]|uniref:hypothetical protein n=1 Tax=Microbacterium sp. cx-55 TaxID=2875948 RepID=UPI001CC0CDD1|nr:hypothetical protein [Microbacterium sp. cx-55]UGB35834.1 hypothetical protein LQ938_03275 [Microbacterium sp. cx-55]